MSISAGGFAVGFGVKTHATRFGAWNAPPGSLTQGRGWDVASPPLKESPPQRAAYHELGHMLGYIAAQAPVILDGIKVSHNGSGWTEYHPRRSPLKFTLPEKLNLLIGWDAGEAMERLIYGTVDPLAGKGDREKTQALALDVCETARQDFPEMLPAIRQFFKQREMIVREHLTQFSRQTIDLLAQQLRKDKHWDAAKILRLRQKFQLNQVSSRVDSSRKTHPATPH
ncbi:MAG TPA: hypothetical protein V6C52_08655 [Coleofasciculaceae cyanobacterium]